MRQILQYLQIFYCMTVIKASRNYNTLLKYNNLLCILNKTPFIIHVQCIYDSVTAAPILRCYDIEAFYTKCFIFLADMTLEHPEKSKLNLFSLKFKKNRFLLCYI